VPPVSPIGKCCLPTLPTHSDVPAGYYFALGIISLICRFRRARMGVQQEVYGRLRTYCFFCFFPFDVGFVKNELTIRGTKSVIRRTINVTIAFIYLFIDVLLAANIFKDMSLYGLSDLVVVKLFILIYTAHGCVVCIGVTRTPTEVVILLNNVLKLDKEFQGL